MLLIHSFCAAPRTPCVSVCHELMETLRTRYVMAAFEHGGVHRVAAEAHGASQIALVRRERVVDDFEICIRRKRRGSKGGRQGGSIAFVFCIAVRTIKRVQRRRAFEKTEKKGEAIKSNQHAFFHIGYGGSFSKQFQ